MITIIGTLAISAVVAGAIFWSSVYAAERYAERKEAKRLFREHDMARKQAARGKAYFEITIKPRRKK